MGALYQQRIVLGWRQKGKSETPSIRMTGHAIHATAHVEMTSPRDETESSLQHVRVTPGWKPAMSQILQLPEQGWETILSPEPPGRNPAKPTGASDLQNGELRNECCF